MSMTEQNLISVIGRSIRASEESLIQSQWWSILRSVLLTDQHQSRRWNTSLLPKALNPGLSPVKHQIHISAQTHPNAPDRPTLDPELASEKLYSEAWFQAAHGHWDDVGASRGILWDPGDVKLGGELRNVVVCVQKIDEDIRGGTEALGSVDLHR